MAYMSQEKKAQIAAKLKQVMPRGWRYSLAVHNHSELCCTIRSAPVDLLAESNAYRQANWNPALHHGDAFSPAKGELGINPYYPEGYFDEGRTQQLKNILTALNDGNHDNSDAMSDYFDVGWYVSLGIGKYDKPFEVKA